jgi:hypothetical protein
MATLDQVYNSPDFRDHTRSKFLAPETGAPPISRTPNPAGLDGVEVNVLDLLVVFSHGAQGTIEEATLATRAAAR